MKKGFLAVILLVMFTAILAASAWAEETALPQDIDALIAQYEPKPYAGVSLYQSKPFDPISITPQRFQKDVANL